MYNLLNSVSKRLSLLTSQFYSLMMINIGNFTPALIGVIVLPIYISELKDDYSKLSIGLTILSVAYIFEGGVSRVTALRIQKLLPGKIVGLDGVQRELNIGFFYTNAIYLCLTPIGILVNLYIYQFNLYNMLSFSIYFYVLSVAAIYRSYMDVTGHYEKTTISKILYTITLNASILTLVLNDCVTLERIIMAGLISKFIDLIYLWSASRINFYFYMPTKDEIANTATNVLNNFISNFIGSAFFVIDKLVVINILSSSNASSYMAWQDIILKYAIFLSAFTTLFLKTANDIKKKQTLKITMLVVHIIFTSAFMIIFSTFDLEIGVLNETGLVLYFTFSVGIIFNALASLELIQLQSLGKYKLILGIQAVELTIFLSIVYALSGALTKEYIALIWTLRMILDYSLITLNAGKK